MYEIRNLFYESFVKKTIFAYCKKHNLQINTINYEKSIFNFCFSNYFHFV